MRASVIFWERGVSHAQGRIFHNIDRRNWSRRERMRLAARPESHSRCRSVAGGDGTRQISVLSITAQDENESMAMTREQKARLKIKIRLWNKETFAD